MTTKETKQASKGYTLVDLAIWKEILKCLGPYYRSIGRFTVRLQNW